MRSGLKKLVLLAICGVLTFGMFGCGKKGEIYDNENDPLVMATLECDRVFNPFFTTSATDSNMVGMTQISMIANDSAGNPVVGANEPVAALDYQVITTGKDGDENQTTEYRFVLKNNVKFSDGTPLTIKDVLFNFYVYLDNAYTGSSTVYSTDIVGLKEYRTQESDEKQQDSFMKQFETAATNRIDNLVNAINDIKAEMGSDFGSILETQLIERLTQIKDEDSTEDKVYAHIVEDYQKACELFREELKEDWSNARDSFADISFSDEQGKVYKPFTTDVEAFLFNEGAISWNKKDGKLESLLVNDPADLKTWTEEQAKNAIYNMNIPGKIDEVVQYWKTSSTLHTFLTNQALEDHFQGQTLQYPDISGIKFANRTAPVQVNGVTYNVPKYDSLTKAVTEGNEVLSITIHKVDPKAIWNFSIPIAPMHYYSDEAHINAFNFETCFGVEYSSQSFMTSVVKNPDKIGVPVGAGAYAASKASGGLDGVASGDFYDHGVVYFERNPHFVLGPAKIKKLRYQVVSTAQMLNQLYSGDVDFVEPSAKPETQSELNGKKKDGIGNKAVKTMGYGYIGVNASKIPSIKVRQAIMHAINTNECVDYYKTQATAIHRSMSTSSWAYPKGATAYYPYIGGDVPEDLSKVNPDYADYVREKGKKAGERFTIAEQVEFIESLVQSDPNYHFSKNGAGIFQAGDHECKYTFTIAGEETDHPAWGALFHSGELLGRAGFDITVTTDSNALRKLGTGSLTVWAAAWSSTIDPDMYQVYHKDSNASSVENWGYRQIKMNVGNRYSVEKDILEELSDLIDEARTYTEQKDRAPIYADALDLVMQMAVELPTYQRDDLFAYNAEKLNEGTMNGNPSPFKGLLSDMHKVSLITER